MLFFRKTALVVDDDPVIRSLLKAPLTRKLDLVLLEAANGHEGLRLAESKHPSIILLDWMLPDIPGIDVLSALKRQPRARDIPVVMLTGKSRKGDIEEAFSRGASWYVTKPLILGEVGNKVKAVLDGTIDAQSRLNIAS